MKFESWLSGGQSTIPGFGVISLNLKMARRQMLVVTKLSLLDSVEVGRSVNSFDL